MAYQPEDLADLEVALLGVLSIGLPPARAAGSETFRIDHVTAVVAGLAAQGRGEVHLEAGGLRATTAFRQSLRDAILSLAERGILAASQPAGAPAAPGGFEAGLELDLVDPDEHPAVLDRYLGQLCMERLFNVPAVYPYLMERYSSSGEVWRRIRESGYARD
ncbi:MAG: hypothetical protein HY875_08720 [Chloroflexi bacterium]|nr:hypothetical protein [Chloroflexota bacterium]